MKTISHSLLLAPDAEAGAPGHSDPDRVVKLEQLVDSLERQLADARSGLLGVPAELRAMVLEKRAAGLDLKTAIESAAAQLAWDKSQKPTKK